MAKATIEHGAWLTVKRGNPKNENEAEYGRAHFATENSTAIRVGKAYGKEIGDAYSKHENEF